MKKILRFIRHHKEQQRVFLFLGGLDDEFEPIRGEVLCKEPTLSLQASYDYVRRESDMKDVLKGSGKNAKTMVVRYRLPHNQSNSSSLGGRPYTASSERTGHSNCAQCNFPGHSKAKCYELIGCHKGWRTKRDAHHSKQHAALADET